MIERDLNNNCLAIRSGDYYMFDYESDQEEDEEKQDEATRAQEEVKDSFFSSEIKIIDCLDSPCFNIQ